MSSIHRTAAKCEGRRECCLCLLPFLPVSDVIRMLWWWWSRFAGDSFYHYGYHYLSITSTHNNDSKLETDAALQPTVMNLSVKWLLLLIHTCDHRRFKVIKSLFLGRQQSKTRLLSFCSWAKPQTIIICIISAPISRHCRQKWQPQQQQQCHQNDATDVKVNRP